MRRNPFLSRAARPQSGFTLMEMLVVLVIIGLVVGLVGPQLFGKAEKAKVQTAETQVKMLRGAVETMRLDISRLPTAEEGLELLVRKPSDERAARGWSGPYLNEDTVPTDPWGNAYKYAPTASGSRPFAVYSLGADGQPGGEGLDADVGDLPKQ